MYLKSGSTLWILVASTEYGLLCMALHVSAKTTSAAAAKA
jgi:hypothetical protein